MENMGVVAELITNVGFPIACVICLGAFVFIIYKNTNKQNAETLEAVQTRCAAREEKLYQQIEKAQEINGKAIATIAHYAEKLDTIQQDVSEIKKDITVILAKDQ